MRQRTFQYERRGPRCIRDRYITACIENEQYEQSLQYIHSSSEEIEASRVTVYCENEAANLILSSFADRAKAQSIPLAVHRCV